MSRDEYIAFLEKELKYLSNGVYCDTCSEESCEDCHRKSMGYAYDYSVVEKMKEKFISQECK